jgi:outer membrane protein OmpA-like peptidoglycan-associated protein
MDEYLTVGYIVARIFLMQCIEKYVLFPAAACLCLSSCAPSSIGGVPAPQPLYTQAQTIGLEDSDRINRFERLAEADGIEPPTVEQIYAPAGTVPGALGPVPVVSVSFDEGVFFASGQDTPLPGALAVINLIAQNMQRDVPDAALTIIGNTDSVGTDAYNDDLSERRAIHVMRLLTEDGLDPLQMTTVAIGDRQPVAPNDTPEGRAKNRRVEFLISASVQANLAAVQYQKVDPAFLRKSDYRVSAATVAPTTVTVLQSHVIKVAGVDKIGLLRVGPMQIESASAAPGDVSVRQLAPPPDVSMRDLQPVSQANLTDIIVK